MEEKLTTEKIQQLYHDKAMALGHKIYRLLAPLLEAHEDLVHMLGLNRDAHRLQQEKIAKEQKEEDVKNALVNAPVEAQDA